MSNSLLRNIWALILSVFIWFIWLHRCRLETVMKAHTHAARSPPPPRLLLNLLQRWVFQLWQVILQEYIHYFYRVRSAAQARKQTDNISAQLLNFLQPKTSAKVQYQSCVMRITAADTPERSKQGLSSILKPKRARNFTTQRGLANKRPRRVLPLCHSLCCLHLSFSFHPQQEPGASPHQRDANEFN